MRIAPKLALGLCLLVSAVARGQLPGNLDSDFIPDTASGESGTGSCLSPGSDCTNDHNSNQNLAFLRKLMS